MRGKRGIGVIVVSVFIILITVVAIAATWFWVVPWTQELDDYDDMNANLRIVLEGYTAYDIGEGMAFVQVKRGVDDADVVALDIIFSIDGNSVIFRTEDAPGNNLMKTYPFDFVEYGIEGIPQYVEVAPVFSRGIRDVVGFARGEVVISTKKVSLDDWDAARDEAKKNVLKRDIVPIVEEVIGPPVSICKDDFSPGEIYDLSGSMNVLAGSNCFVIDVDDVVLNLNGYLINGSYSGYGVWITGDNVTVKNGRIERFEKGIFIDGVGTDNNTIVDNRFFDNNNSIYIWNSVGNFVSGNNMTNGNYSNIYLKNAYTNHVADNWACGSPNDILCENSGIENSGTGNTFSSVVNCPNDWLGNGGYTEC